MDPKVNFSNVAPTYMRMLIEDFGVTVEEAAAVFGNAGYESLGFTKLQEIKPVVKGSRGGYGWFQWTGPRRRAFEAYCKKNGFDPSSNDANYKFLFVELTTTEKRSLDKLKAASGLDNKVIAFEDAFERAGVKRYPERVKWARIALEAYKDTQATPIAPTPTEAPTEQPRPKEEASDWFSTLIRILRKLFR